MAASPVTGDRPSGFRRSSSQFAALPQRSLSFHEKAGLANDDADADVLYAHPSVRIFLFQPPTDALEHLDKTKKTLPDADYPIDAIEVLPWRSRTETLSAKGKLIIEKVQGSVHFLKAGHLIHTIMRNSQCWCVDGESKFVMRVGRLRYQRIEFPTAEPEEKAKVAEFKEVIAKILKFEKTPCPFIRGFQVDLPEDAITPRRRGTWKRKESLTSTALEDGSPTVRRGKATRASSMRGTPPTSFPSRSITYLDNDRPRTATTPNSAPRFSFPDMRTDSPTNYTSGEDNTDSDRHDSESDRPESSQQSEVEDSDRETRVVPIIRSPLKNVQSASTRDASSESSDVRPPAAAARRASTVESQIKMFEQYKAKPIAPIVRRDSRIQSQPIDLQKSDASLRATAESNESSAQEPEYSAMKNEPLPDSGVISDTDSSDGFSSEKHQPGPEVPPEKEPDVNAHSLNENVHDLHLSNMPSSELQIPVTTPLETESLLDQPRHTADNSNIAIMPRSGSIRDNIPKSEEDSPINESMEHDSKDLKLVMEEEKHQPTTAVATEAATEVLKELRMSPGSTKDSSEQPVDYTEIREEVNALQRIESNDDAKSMVSSDSFHTTLSDEALDQHNKFLPESSNTRPFSHRRELSEMTVTAASLEYDILTAAEVSKDQPSASSASQEAAQVISEPLIPGNFNETSELRQRLRHRRSLSPLPPASILSPASPNGQSSAIPTVLLQKAATLAVVKPIEVVFFVARILARIAQGATMNDLVSGDLFRRPGGPRRTASGTFEQAIQSRGRTSTRDGFSDEEDDYGLPVLGRRKNSNMNRTEQVTPDAESSSQSSLD